MCTIMAMAVITLLVIFLAILRVNKLSDADESDKIKKILWSRYLVGYFPKTNLDQKDEIANGDRLIAYVERIIDRQINKTRGILPFNSILIAAFNFERNKLLGATSWRIDVPAMISFAIIGLAISSALCLVLFFVRRGKSNHYESFSAQFEWIRGILRSRSSVIEWATILSLAAFLVGIASITAVEIGAQIWPPAAAHVDHCGGGAAAGARPAAADGGAGVARCLGGSRQSVRVEAGVADSAGASLAAVAEEARIQHRETMFFLK
ncbi:MAG: hypothetical protein ACLPKB_24355 [Xanthobacteraceae bacterium]